MPPGWVGRDLEGAVVSIPPLDLRLLSGEDLGLGFLYGSEALCVHRFSEHHPRGGMWV